MGLDERDFFNNRNETRTDKLSCPRCRRTNDYQMRRVVRTKKDRLPPGADDGDRALYAKLRASERSSNGTATPRYAGVITANARRSPVMCGVPNTTSTQPK